MAVGLQGLAAIAASGLVWLITLRAGVVVVVRMGAALVAAGAAAHHVAHLVWHFEFTCHGVLVASAQTANAATGWGGRGLCFMHKFIIRLTKLLNAN